MIKMNARPDGEIINGPGTYKAIAEYLKKGKGSVLIGWTDEHYTHYDILFTYTAMAALSQALNGVFLTTEDENGKEDFEFLSGSFQGGIRPSDLFISIMRVGSFGFEINGRDTDPDYYEEKFRFKFGDESKQKVADLFNGVRKELYAGK